jgi:N-acetylated-alpha-linked acidic dipeptidase
MCKLTFTATAPGDPTTPGYPSKPGVPRVDPHLSTPSIPSIPISYTDALPLLKALNGIGPNASSFNKYWQGGGLSHKGVKYNIGPSPDDVVLNLVNEQEYKITPLWNVIGVINGSISDEVVVIGNHRDAWIAGGAGDPNSGSAALNEVIRAFGVALKSGWTPRRTIVFASWDGEEYGLVGSTEWVEEYLPWLSNSGVAYLNVDVGARGSDFKVSASPLFKNLIWESVHEVASPNQTTPGQTIGDLWDGHIGTIGSGSDFTAFEDFAGVGSIDMGFGGAKGDPVYHYHSNYDSFHWMDTYGDSEWKHHLAITKLWGLIAAKIIEAPKLPLQATTYAQALEGYIETLETAYSEELQSNGGFSFTLLKKQLKTFIQAATEFDLNAENIAAELKETDKWYNRWKRVFLCPKLAKVNLTIKNLERAFLYQPGLDGRPWFKHVVFAPGRWTGYAGVTFPGLAEALEDKDLVGATKWALIITESIKKAKDLLVV